MLALLKKKSVIGYCNPGKSQFSIDKITVELVLYNIFFKKEMGTSCDAEPSARGSTWWPVLVMCHSISASHERLRSVGWGRWFGRWW